MPIQVAYNPDSQICEINISGPLSPSEFASSQKILADHIAAGHRPRIFVRLDGFEGWAEGGSWDNLDFMFTHGQNIARIAIIGDKRWEAEVKMFTGADYRSTPVGYFETGLDEPAMVWLLG